VAGGGVAGGGVAAGGVAAGGVSGGDVVEGLLAGVVPEPVPVMTAAATPPPASRTATPTPMAAVLRTNLGAIFDLACSGLFRLPGRANAGFAARSPGSRWPVWGSRSGASSPAGAPIPS
jgi:hypothetical protein